MIYHVSSYYIYMGLHPPPDLSYTNTYTPTVISMLVILHNKFFNRLYNLPIYNSRKSYIMTL